MCASGRGVERLSQSFTGPTHRGVPTGQSVFPTPASASWEEMLPCAAAGAAHIQLFCSCGWLHRSAISSIPACVGGARQRGWDSRAAGAWIPLGNSHLLEAPSKGFSLSLQLTSCVLLLLLASLDRSSNLCPTQPERNKHISSQFVLRTSTQFPTHFPAEV